MNPNYWIACVCLLATVAGPTHAQPAKALTFRAGAATSNITPPLGSPIVAEHEALELGHNYVGSEHPVLAMALGTDGQLSALFQKNNVGHERLREIVVKLLHG